MMLRFHDLEKYAPMSTRTHHQTWLAGRLRSTNVVQVNLKVTDDATDDSLSTVALATKFE